MVSQLSSNNSTTRIYHRCGVEAAGVAVCVSRGKCRFSLIGPDPVSNHLVLGRAVFIAADLVRVCFRQCLTRINYSGSMALNGRCVGQKLTAT